MPKKKKTRVFKELAALKGLIREKGTSYRKIADEIGIATATFSNKINGFTCFDAMEIDAICDQLDIQEREVGRYFFPHRCSNHTKTA